LNAFGRTEEDVAISGCNAVYSLARTNEDNVQELLRVGAREAVGSCRDTFEKTKALEALGVVLPEVKRDPLTELEVALQNNDFVQVVEILHIFGGFDAKVARAGCVAVANLAFDNAREFGRLGACAEVVMSLRAFGHTDRNVAEQGCSAVYCLAFCCGDNVRELVRVGARDVVRSCMECHAKDDALKELDEESRR
jgi:hypothetical protein